MVNETKSQLRKFIFNKLVFPQTTVKIVPGPVYENKE